VKRPSEVPILSAELYLSERDHVLAEVIAARPGHWPSTPTEDPIWGLVRMVVAQQVSTHLACTIADRLKSSFPTITGPGRDMVPSVTDLRAFGLPERRAQSCVDILIRADEILEKVREGGTWDSALFGIKGIGPWTLSTFKVMVLREPDILPLGDVGLERAVRNVYGETADVQQLAEKWKPYRSVACWYLWRTLGNKQLG
jgi:DNA-3-methyladenine glycosylase II